MNDVTLDKLITEAENTEIDDCNNILTASTIKSKLINCSNIRKKLRNNKIYLMIDEKKVEDDE